MRFLVAFLFALVLGAAGIALYAMRGGGPAATAADKPQTPRPPFPYASEALTIATPDGAATLAGTLTIPQGGGRFPAVVLLSVAGPADRDQSFAGHRGFFVLADRLTRSGYAVARFDDRGVGGSTGDYFAADWSDLADDARAIVARLAADPRIDASRIGLAGMSQGGAVAAIAASRGEGVAFLILMSAPGLPGEEALRLQLEKLMQVSGVADERAERYRALFADYVAIVKSDPADPATRARLGAFLKGPGRALIPPYQFLPKDDEALIDVLLGPWYRSNLLFDPASSYGGVAAPTLILAGDKDFVAPADAHAAAIQRILIDAPTDDVTLAVLPGVNHLLQDAKTGLPTEYAGLESSFSTRALDEIERWLTRRRPATG